MSTRFSASAPLLAILLATAVSCSGPETASVSGTDGAADEPATVRFFANPERVPSFSATTIDGRHFSSADLAGKVTLVNFWATWCAPCRAEIPDLVALQAKYGEQLQIIGISEDEGAVDEVERFVAEHQINYPIVMATPELHEAFPGIVALPTSFVLDREARIVQRVVGLLDPVMTEHATRALAGLEVNARIERVEPDQPVGLADTAHVKEIPGVDLSSLSSGRRAEALQRLNTEACTCGCGLTVAKCRIDDPACGVSLPVARRIVEEIAAAH